MREYVFTPHEKRLLAKYLEDGVKGDGFRTLMTRMRKNVSSLHEDVALMEDVLNKVESVIST